MNEHNCCLCGSPLGKDAKPINLNPFASGIKCYVCDKCRDELKEILILLSISLRINLAEGDYD